ncbi:MAG: hypothetical protein KKB34_04930 [Bacteroidetes bacterium]|nr:hypothetical protein [Bacteroidota bacterium]
MTNKALIKFAEERIDSNETLQTFIERSKDLIIPLLPETIQFADTGLKYGIALVSVDTQLDKYGNNRDIYRNESGGYCLHLTKLNEIAQQSGIQITDSRILERRVDESGKIVFINHQVRGRMRSIDGSIKEAVTTGKYDYYRDLEKYNKEGQIKSRRSHAEALAESNAMTRLYNKLIAKIPSSFSLEEFRKSFAVPYVLEDKDELLKQLPPEEQAKIRADLVKKRLGLMDTMYPSGNMLPGNNNSQNSSADADYTEIPNTLSNGNGATPPDTPPTTTLSPGMSEEEQNHILAEEYRDVIQKERTDKILTLIELKGYEDPKGNPITAKRIETNDLNKQIKFIEILLNLPEADEGGDLV